MARSLIKTNDAIFCGDTDGVIRVRSLEDGSVMRTLEAHTAPVTCMQMEDSMLFSGSLDMSIIKWMKVPVPPHLTPFVCDGRLVRVCA